jgi:hypothetical protein
VAEVGRLRIEADRRKNVSRVRKEWTLKQAQGAQDRYVARGGRLESPEGPLFQWGAMHWLEKLQARFESGEKYALATALRVCANHALPMPPWVARAYIRGFDAVHNYRAESWDALFGPAIAKGRHSAALRKRRELSMRVWNEVNEVKRGRKTRQRTEGGTPIDDLLFAGIGKKLSIGVKLVKEYYAIEKRRHEALLTEWDQPGNPIGALLRPYQNPKKK